MKKFTFFILISCSLLAAAQTSGQSFGQNGNPILLSPADHSAFYAYPEDNIVVLRWQTGNERNVDHYVIEHSTDSIHFDPLREVVSKGAIDADSSYEDAEPYPPSPVNYYRLKTIDNDGNFFYSAIVRADVADKRGLVLKPTVLHMGGTVRMDGYHQQPLTINFFNDNGTLTGTFIVNSTSFDIPTNGWGKGIYFYRISDEQHPLIYAGKIMIL